MCVLVITTGWPIWVFVILVSKSITAKPQVAWHWHKDVDETLQVCEWRQSSLCLPPFAPIQISCFSRWSCKRSGMCPCYVVTQGGRGLMVLEVLKLASCKLLLGCRSYCGPFPCQLSIRASSAPCCFALHFSGRERSVAGLVRGNLNRNFC